MKPFIAVSSHLIFAAVLSSGLIGLFVAGTVRAGNEIPPPAKRAEDVHPLGVGDKVPEGEILDIKGNRVELLRLIRRKPTVLIFYRGGWCPYCNRQLSGLVRIEDHLIQLGYQILAISADRPEKLRVTKQKIKMKYQLLSDAPMRLARKFGLAFELDSATLERYRSYGIDLEDASGYKHHLLPVPAVYIVDKEGEIHFVYFNPNYKVRMDTDRLLEVARRVVSEIE